MSGGQVKQSEISLGPLRRSDLNSKLSCRAINHPSANPLEATVQIDMNCKYLSATGYIYYISATHSCGAGFSSHPLHNCGAMVERSRRLVNGNKELCLLYKDRDRSATAFWDASGNHCGERHTFISLAPAALRHATIPFSSSDLLAFIDFGTEKDWRGLILLICLLSGLKDLSINSKAGEINLDLPGYKERWGHTLICVTRALWVETVSLFNLNF